jgi:hypothetical protein
MTSQDHLTQLDQIAWTIERTGIAGVPDQLLIEIADEANRLGVRPVAAGVLANTGDPANARARAFGRIAPGLARTYHSDLNRRFSRAA